MGKYKAERAEIHIMLKFKRQFSQNNILLVHETRKKHSRMCKLCFKCGKR